jgi:hypothetical protein
MKTTIRTPHPLPLLTASISLLLASLCGLALMIIYDIGDYQTAAKCGMFAVIFMGHAILCLFVALDRAAVREVNVRHPRFRE